MTTLSVLLYLLCILSNCDGLFPLRPNDANQYCKLAIYDDSNEENLAEICNQISETREVCINSKYHWFK